MKKRFAIAFAMLSLGLGFLAGCTAEEGESTIPQARPASWEHTVPGMPTTPGAPRY